MRGWTASKYRNKRTEAPGPTGALRLYDSKPNKYGAIKKLGPNFMGGQRLYRSQWEAEVARQLQDEMHAGQLAGVEPEVSLIVGYTEDQPPKPIRHLVDFLVRDHEGVAWIVEAKGKDLDTGRTKRGVLVARGWKVQVRTKARGVPR